MSAANAAAVRKNPLFVPPISVVLRALPDAMVEGARR
jgi:hypothetical protein